MAEEENYDPSEQLRVYREIIAQEIEKMIIVAFAADQQRIIDYVQQSIANKVRRLYGKG